jgi:hypothetical protein
VPSLEPTPDAPLISIGVPTYNRGALLDRAVASALAQTVEDLEVVISDNASSDDTQQRCADWAARDPRVRVVRRAINLGPTENFNSLFTGFRGRFVMLLSDDDWLDPDYVATCLARLQAEPQLAVVAGTARYVRGEVFVREGAATQLPQTTARERVLAYYRAADDGPFYGLMRREALHAAVPMPNVLANDWLHVGRLATQGAIAMVDTVHIHRELGGTSASIEGILQTFGASTLGARAPHLVMARHVFADVGWRGAAHTTLGGRATRLAIAARCAPGVINWPSLAWHLTAPTMLRLHRRPRGRPLARAYERITKALGAGQGD